MTGPSIDRTSLYASFCCEGKTWFGVSVYTGDERGRVLTYRWAVLESMT